MKGLVDRIIGLRHPQPQDRSHAGAASKPCPDSFAEAYRLALAAHRLGDTDAAIEYMTRAAALEPSNPSGWRGLAEMFQALGRVTDMERVLRTVVGLDPADDSALNALGAALCSQGRMDEAIPCFKAAIDVNPSNAQALNNLANVCNDRGELASAESLYRRALDVKDDFPEAWNNLGVVQQNRGEFDRAERSFQRAVALAPRFADAHVNLGAALQRRGRFEEAECAYREALDLQPDLPVAHSNLGDLLQIGGNLELAEAHCRRALELRHDFADPWNNLATIHRRRGELALAEDACHRALAIRESHIGALNNLGAILRERQEFAAAERTFRRALSVAPDDPVTRYNLGVLLLLSGDYRDGFELYESRLEAFAPSSGYGESAPVRCARWHGEPLLGKSLLVWTEQGLGDSLMAMRYLPLLMEKGVREVAVYCPPELARLVEEMGIGAVIAHGKDPMLPDTDFHCPIMSLPRAFGTTLESVPAQTPYFKVSDAMRSFWKDRLGEGAKPWVGVVWAGSSTLRDDARRSIPLATFAPILECEAVECISLQKGERANDWTQRGLGGGDHIDSCADLMDTAALIENLDLVISVDTAVAHLAGALGKRVWLLDRYGSEWRWGKDGDSTPWYPTMRIFRQGATGDWRPAIAAISSALTDVNRGLLE